MNVSVIASGRGGRRRHVNKLNEPPGSVRECERVCALFLWFLLHKLCPGTHIK